MAALRSPTAPCEPPFAARTPSGGASFSNIGPLCPKYHRKIKLEGSQIVQVGEPIFSIS
jgi:hypothetical protein